MWLHIVWACAQAFAAGGTRPAIRMSKRALLWRPGARAPREERGRGVSLDALLLEGSWQRVERGTTSILPLVVPGVLVLMKPKKWSLVLDERPAWTRAKGTPSLLGLVRAAHPAVLPPPPLKRADGSGTGAPGWWPHALVTRLDVPSSGLVMLAEGERGPAALAEQMQTYSIDRCYVVEVAGAVAAAGVVRAALRGIARREPGVHVAGGGAGRFAATWHSAVAHLASRRRGADCDWSAEAWQLLVQLHFEEVRASIHFGVAADRALETTRE